MSDPFGTWGGGQDFYQDEIPIVITADAPQFRKTECRKCHLGRPCAGCQHSTSRGVLPSGRAGGQNSREHFNRGGPPHDRDYPNSDGGATLDAVYRAGWDERPSHYNGGWGPASSGDLHLGPPAYRGPWQGPAWAPYPLAPYTQLSQCATCAAREKFTPQESGKKDAPVSSWESIKSDVIIVLLFIVVLLMALPYLANVPRGIQQHAGMQDGIPASRSEQSQ